MATSTGKTIGIILLIAIAGLLVLRMTPFMLAPFGIISNVFDRVETSVSSGFHGWSRGFFGLPFIPLFSFLLLILWIVVIAWVYRDAEKRGMNGVLWALLVFIGNIIGLLIYLIVRSDNRSAPPKTVETYICSNCKKSIQPQFKFCPSCGETLDDVCPKCKKPVKTDWKVCPDCGEKLSD